eukprot:CAMPEP_0172655430 /NCGR_PEP_ID=MMETSP1074-20121228/634_1 /TAXON_ID=2916 /ORGANISM="Ceratium fusus, Strain PA161109" /LENGTH=60 /DNA_ID=CAMNT_0013470051 /DNA_START=502 /DNA_END=684 /DNA_ORIENTATION=-
MRSTTPCLRMSLAAKGAASRSSKEELRNKRAKLMVGMINAGTNAIARIPVIDKASALQYD